MSLVPLAKEFLTEEFKEIRHEVLAHVYWITNKRNNQGDHT